MIGQNRRWLTGCLAVVLALLTACSEASNTLGGVSVNYWAISVVAPKHYDVWVDHLFLEAPSRNLGWRAPIGSLSCCWKDPAGKSAEWQAMPEYIVVQWFSFAEQQSYTAIIKFEDPDALFKEMLEPAPFDRNDKTFNWPRSRLVLGLAPGGTVVVWIMNRAENAIEVGRYQADPYTNQKSDYTQWVEEYMQREGQYLEMHGIPYNSW